MEIAVKLLNLQNNESEYSHIADGARRGLGPC